MYASNFMLFVCYPTPSKPMEIPRENSSKTFKRAGTLMGSARTVRYEPGRSEARQWRRIPVILLGYSGAVYRSMPIIRHISSNTQHAINTLMMRTVACSNDLFRKPLMIRCRQTTKQRTKSQVDLDQSVGRIQATW